MNREFTEAEAAPPEEPTLDAGARFGRYEIVRLLGSGGFGHVYEATHRELGKRVALKVLRREFALHPTVRARFAREGQAASRLRHPNVVDVTDVGAFDGQPYLVMELLEGETLRARIARDGAMAPDRVVDLMLPVLDAIAEAHDRGLVHRDLKPENIFLSRSGARPEIPKVLDFGVVKLDEDRGAAMLTGSGILLGTPSYMSPEQAQDVRELDGQSDQFSLGAIVYECLDGRRAFEADGVLTTLQRVANDPPPPLRASLPEGLRAAVERAMQKRPSERFPSVRAFAAALLPYASEPVRAQWSTLEREVAAPPPAVVAQAVSGPRTLQGRVRAAKTPQRALIGAWIVALTLIAGASFALWRQYASPRPSSPIASAPMTVPEAREHTTAAPVEAPPETPPAAPVEAPPAASPAAPAVALTAAPTLPQRPVAPVIRNAARSVRRAPAAGADAGVVARRVGANGAVIED